MGERLPTKKQFARLSGLPVGHAVLNPRRNDWRPLLNHGWVEPAFRGADDHGYSYSADRNQYLPALRITADGLRALAEAIDKHGQPEAIDPRTQVEAVAQSVKKTVA